MNVPTVLTLCRMFAGPLMVCVVAQTESLGLLPHQAFFGVAVLYVVAAFTDWLDGFLARSWHQTTPLGGFLDQVADKVLVACVLLLLSASQGFAVAMPAALILSRDFVMSALRSWAAELGVLGSLRVVMAAKVKTMIQMFALGWLLWWQVWPWGYLQELYLVGLGLLWLAALLGIYSLILYVRAAAQVFSQNS